MARHAGALLGLALLCLVGNWASMASMMAVDLGSEYLKVALIKPGKSPISIVVNEMSRRKSPALVGVVNGERLLGEEAFSLSVRYPQSIFTRVRDLLGRPASDPSLHRMLKAQSLPFMVVPHSPERQTAAVQSKEGSVHSAEELLASLLQYAQGIAEAQSGAPVPDAVVAVPPFFGQAQRQALQDAAQLAGINLMGIINSHTAAALKYGIEKDFADKMQHVIFYDLGSGSTVASLVKYSSYEVKEAGKPKAISQLEVKEVEWDAECGSNNLDALLVQHFAKDFAAKHGLDVEAVMGNPRTMAKMRKQVRRTKEILSANSAAPLSVEELHDGIDYQASITREQFETLAGPFFEQAAQPLKAVLERSGLKAEEVDFVEILGGGSRIPKVQAMLQDALQGRVLDKHMDADESVVLGASLFAANLSTSFRLRKFGMVDAAMYGVSLRFDELHKVDQQHQDQGAAAPAPEADGEEKVRNLLPYMKKLPVRRIVHFNNLTRDPIRLSLFFNASAPHGLPPGTDPAHAGIGTYEVTGIDTVVGKYNSSGVVNLRFETGYDGILNFDRAEAVVQYTVMEERIKYLKPANSSTTNSTEAGAEGAGAGAEKEAPAAAGAEDAAVEEEGATEGAEAAEEEQEQPKEAEEGAGEGAAEGRKLEEGAKGAEGAAAPEGDAAAKAAEDIEKNIERVMVPRIKTAKVRLNITTTWAHPVLAGEPLAKARAIVASWMALEHAKRDNAAAKNELEGYIIKTRNALEDDEKLLKVTTEEQRDSFAQALRDAEDWLYEEGDAEVAKVFREKLAGLKLTGDPMQLRALEFERRPTTVGVMRKDADLKLSAARMWETSKPWITAEERADAEKKVTDFLAWLDAQEEAQAKKQAHEQAAFTTEQVMAEYDKYNKAFNKIANKRKPKPPPEPPAPSPTPGEGEAKTEGEAEADGEKHGGEPGAREGGEAKSEGEQGQQKQQEGAEKTEL